MLFRQAVIVVDNWLGQAICKAKAVWLGPVPLSHAEMYPMTFCDIKTTLQDTHSVRSRISVAISLLESLNPLGYGPVYGPLHLQPPVSKCTHFRIRPP